MNTFPKYQPITTVLKAVKANIKAHQPDSKTLPTIGYIGFAEPSGTKAVLELDNEGNLIGTNSKVAQKWAEANVQALLGVFKNLTTAHGDLPVNMTLTLVGYLSNHQLHLVDAQLAVDGKYSAYWLPLAVLTELVEGVEGVNTAFQNAVYTEIDFNKIEEFANTIAANQGDVKMLWHCSPHSETPSAPVLRDPYRIVL